MCNVLYLSTDSPDDLTVHNTELLRFEKQADDPAKPGIALLAYPNRWYVGSKSGCSCTFRRFCVGNTMEFGEPVDWHLEGQDEIDASAQFYSVVESLLTAGHQVDCLDTWNDELPAEIETIHVSFAAVSAAAFRFFEGYRFTFDL